jgi:hypothetical protein
MVLTEINRFVGVTKFPKHSKSTEKLEKDMSNCVCPLLDIQYNWDKKMPVKSCTTENYHKNVLNELIRISTM